MSGRSEQMSPARSATERALSDIEGRHRSEPTVTNLER